ncbi:hypothetical protein VE01_10157 [Pseudogymnoascus verrucosus]|uniref:Heterokaryon incompatibility domain-containing protein n=1 Tax=Pseudogymnoascus verrucosus TaxID=342668 RepID=A0A1B8G7N5_9PEZI|nr:uncharacterized protein VE01_10157 [Pseudogymnoascus verrucosus]OBT91837.1 hypothetical protein VE01_10157 [Pseudogymnoascus verrucosus]
MYLSEFSSSQKDQIRREIAHVLRTLSPCQREKKPSFIDNADFVYSEATDRLDLKQIEKTCHLLHDASIDSVDTLKKLDDITASFFDHWFVPWGEWIPSEEVLVSNAYNLILRLPSHPLRVVCKQTDGFNQVQTSDASAFFRRQLTQTECYINRNVIRMALRVCIILERPRQHSRIAVPYWAMAQVTEDIALLFDATRQLCDNDSNLSSKDWIGWCVVKSFLWTSLQRMFMLWTWSITSFNIKDGYTSEIIMKHRIQQDRIRPTILSELARQEEDVILQMRPDPMCPWAFQLLRNDGFSLCIDLRRPLEHYRLLLGNNAPRCGVSSQSQQVCDGKSFESCGRFVGTKVIKQSAHECISKDCKKLTWDEGSYCAFETPVVSIRETTITQLKYTNLSDKTLSISHVWSHGQGGRPEDGFNTCLHDRYVKVAETLGCDSYWMDTPCIPTETVLRKKAIANINYIFMESKATLICDRDLMGIDISILRKALNSDAAVRLVEGVLIALLVCDWNVRGWTFLEAIRGKDALYLLFKDSEVFSLKDLLVCLVDSGNFELANLYLSAGHLLPLPKDLVHYRNAMMYLHGVEEAGSVLSRRPASRPSDNLAIWSLLFSDGGQASNPQPSSLSKSNPNSTRGIKDSAYKSAEQLWRSQGNVSTCYLVSSAPRIQGVRRMSWAPCSPVPDKVESRNGSRRYYPYVSIGDEAEKSWIRHSGLVAEWSSCFFVGQGGGDAQHDESTVVSRPELARGDLKDAEDDESWYHPLDSLDILNRPFNTAKVDLRMKGVHQLNLLTRMGLKLGNTGFFRTSDDATMIELQHISSTFLSGFQWGVLLRPLTTPERQNLQVKPLPLVYEDNPAAPLVAVCGSNDGREWVWRGVHLWDSSVALPSFEVRKLLII